jgi:carbon-monoxide dehydrogenase small subunit
MIIEFVVNGKKEQLDVKPSDILLDVIRDRLHLYGTKRGCGKGECGSCTVLINGEPVNSCIYLAVRADGKEITTIEGLGSADNLHPLQRAFVMEGALQCGYCGTGMLMSAKALLDRTPDPSEKEIREGLAGNLCRCSGYVKIVKAVKSAARELAASGHGAAGNCRAPEAGFMGGHHE